MGSSFRRMPRIKKNEFRFTEDDKSLGLMVKKHKKMRDHLTKLSKAKAKKP